MPRSRWQASGAASGGAGLRSFVGLRSPAERSPETNAVSDELDWNVAVYCANEERRLGGCLERVIAALTGRRALITVMLNGSRDCSLDVAREVAAGGPIEIFRIEAGDKANAINQFMHRLRSPARFYGAVDGYAYIAATSFRAMEERLDTDARAMAVTGVCTNGRTMKLATETTLSVGGTLHGQLHAFRREFLDRMVARGIKLPIGIYWGDGLLGSMAAHNLDALSEAWDNGRVVGIAAATYEIPTLSPLRLTDVQRHLRRKVRQMRGLIEVAAIRDLIYRRGYEGLPDDAAEMVEDYLTAYGPPKVGWVDRVFQMLALRQRAPERAPAHLIPHRVG
jgi:hypothetical protein